MPKRERELLSVGMYVRCERTWIIVGNKEGYTVQVSSVQLSMDIPEQSIFIVYCNGKDFI